MRKNFNEQLQQLNNDLISMSAICETMIKQAAEALTDGDQKLAEKIPPMDAEVNTLERDIETRCLKLLLQQQPVAGDLRLISTALKMITDLERIGDQAADIAEIIGYLGGRSCQNCAHIGEMAEATIKMMTESVDAYVKRDTELAQTVIAYDDVVDELFLKVRKALITLLSEQPDEGEYALDLLMIAKYFERIGDHATNLAEWAIYSVTGIHKTGGLQYE